LNFELGSVCGWDASDAGVFISIDGQQLGGRVFNDSMLCVPDAINFLPFSSPIFQATANTTTIRFRGEGNCTALSVQIGGGCTNVGQLANPGVIGIDNISIEAVNSEANWTNPFSGTIEICPGQDTLLQASIGSSAATYLWNTGATTSSITVDESGYYEVTVTDGCVSGTHGVDVIQNELPDLDLGSDLLGCFPNGASLGQAGESIVWADGAFSTPRTVTATGLYTGTIQNTCGSSTDAVLVTLDSLLYADTLISMEICDGVAGEIELDYDNTFTWIWPDGENDSSYRFASTANFVLEVASACGSFDVAVDLTAINCTAGIFIPNSFTPDGDGINDVWLPVVNDVTIKTCSVYNRWGDEIFVSNNESPVWTGNFKGGPYFVQDHIYTYLLEYVDQSGNIQIAKGHITLIR
jgi:gliding motility-associated-like protein